MESSTQLCSAPLDKVHVNHWEVLTQNPHRIKKKIAIFYAGRSGSMMLSGLLEGHSHLLSFNCYCDARLFHTLKQFVQEGNITVGKFKTEMKDKIHNILDVFYEHPLLPIELRDKKINVDLFLDELAAVCDNVTNEQLDLDLMLNIVFIAFGKTIQYPLNTSSPTMIIQMHSPFLQDDWGFFFENMKNMQILVVARNPLKAIDSHLYHHMFESLSPPWATLYERIMLEYKKSFLPFLDKKMSALSYCIYFEDIHANTEGTMRALCAHLDIPFENVLLTETVQGKLAAFPTAGKVVSGTSKDRGKDAALRVMRDSDVKVVEYLFADLIVELGYSLQNPGEQPQPSESFLTERELEYIISEIQDDYKTLNSSKIYFENLIHKYKYFKKVLNVMSTVFESHRNLLKLRIDKNETPLRIQSIRPERLTNG